MRKRSWLALLSMVLILSFIGCGKAEEATAPESAPEAEVVTEVAASADAEEVAEVVEEEDGNEYDIIPESFAYSLTVSINPLVELYFDAENVVVGVAFLNEDAVDAYKDLELVGSTLADGVDLLVNAAVDQGYLKEDGTVEIELAKVGEEGDGVTTAVLTEANAAVNQCLAEKALDSSVPTPTQAKVEVKVADEVQEKTELKTPSICPDCNGTGNSCKECGGTGDVRCKRCNNGIESCGTCGGSAIITCHGCHGAGSQTHNRGEEGNVTETCNYCGGSGRQSCDACHGQGTFTCSWCKGALHHICPECWNEGSCATCGGSGTV